MIPQTQNIPDDNPLHEAVFEALDASMKREIDQNVSAIFMEAILLLWFCWHPKQMPTRHEDGSLTWRESDTLGLPELFTPQEWHDISLCTGWIIALSTGDEPSERRDETALRAMEAMRRVIGRTDYHTAIIEANSVQKGG